MQGIVFITLLLVVGIVIYIREKPVPESAMFIFRVVLSLGGAGFACILTGFIDINISFTKVAIMASGSLAVFIIIYKVNPPLIIEAKKKMSESNIIIEAIGMVQIPLIFLNNFVFLMRGRLEKSHFCC